jgi:hypothetical protein
MPSKRPVRIRRRQGRCPWRQVTAQRLALGHIDRAAGRQLRRVVESHADSKKMILDAYAQLGERVERSHGTAVDDLVRGSPRGRNRG